WCLGDLLRRQPDDFDVLVRHGSTAEGLGWHTAAVESYRKAVNLPPDDQSVRVSLALELVSHGQFSEAMEHATYLREREPGNAGVVITPAQCLFGTGRKEDG